MATRRNSPALTSTGASLAFCRIRPLDRPAATSLSSVNSSALSSSESLLALLLAALDGSSSASTGRTAAAAALALAPALPLPLPLPLEAPSAAAAFPAPLPALDLGALPFFSTSSLPLGRALVERGGEGRREMSYVPVGAARKGNSVSWLVYLGKTLSALAAKIHRPLR